MANNYIGEVRMFAGNFAPQGWAMCEGQVMPISQNDALFNLIGTTYGGDGVNTFALPDLRGRIPNHQGQGTGLSSYVIGQNGGTEQVTVTAGQLPAHTHAIAASTAAGSQPSPAGGILASSPSVALYNVNPPDNSLAASSVGTAGGSQPHTNFQPYLCVTFIIALFGIYPSQS
jgi:microcystin-dependent protein